MELVLFDLDGTLVDTSVGITNAVNFALSSAGLAEVPGEMIVRAVGKGFREMLFEAVAPRFDLLFSVVKNLRVYYREHMTDHVKPYTGVADTLKRLHPRTCAIVSNSPEEFIEPILKSVDLAGYFSMIVGGDTLPVHKPDPEPILHVCRTHSIHLDKTVMVGDSTVDIETGQAAGVATVALTGGFHSSEEIQSMSPSVTLKCVEDIQGLLNDD